MNDSPERPLHKAMARVEAGAPLFVWRLDADSPWRVTDWAGVKDIFDDVSDCGRIDLFGPSGTAAAVGAHALKLSIDDFEAELAA